jgi:hypothetical protein
MARGSRIRKNIETLRYEEVSYSNTPTAESRSVTRRKPQDPGWVACEQRERDSRLVWRGVDWTNRLDTTKFSCEALR